MNSLTSGLLFRPRRDRTAQKNNSRWSCESLYVKRYLRGPPSTSELKRYSSERMFTRNPRKAVNLGVLTIFVPWRSVSWLRYENESEKCFDQWSLLSSLIGALSPLPNGFLEFMVSKRASIVLMNLVVAWLPWNCGSFKDSRQKSIEFATLKLKVWTAKLTFIFCLCHWMCSSLSLLPALKPSSSCRLCKLLMNSHLI